jgi:decaprenyl-phosphate phosphoribosyltransferase
MIRLFAPRLEAQTKSASSRELATSTRFDRNRSLLRIARPRQWVKNILILAAPGAAGALSHGTQLARALSAIGVFCLAASGTYFLNDAIDIEADRHHPVKRSRPLAAGEVRVSLAVTVGTSLLCSAVVAAWFLAGWKLTLVLGIYVALTTAYSLRLKHEPVIDLACVSAGFVLRAIAGGVVTGVALSDWFIIVASFGSLFVVTGKRSAEYSELGELRDAHRPALSAYPITFLRSVRLLAMSVTVTSYFLWALERSRQIGNGHPIWFELSILPFVLAILHLELLFERGLGSAPEELALHDRMLQLLGIAWVALFAVGVYA